MTVVLQSIYSKIFGQIEKAVHCGEWEDKTKETWMTVSFFLLCILCIISLCTAFEPRLIVRTGIGCILLFMLMLFMLGRKLSIIRWNPWLIYPWLLCAVLILLSGVLHSVNYLPTALVFLIGITCFIFIANNNKNYKVIFRCLSNAILLNFCVFGLLSILFAPVFNSQYCGIMYNPNALGQYLTAVFPFLLYSFDLSENKWTRRTALGSIGVLSAFIYFSRSRTAVVSVVGMLVIWIFMKLIVEKKLWKKIICVIAAVIIGVPVTFGIMRVSRETINYDMHNLFPEKNEGFTDINQKADLSDISGAIIGRLEVKGKNADTYSTGRLGIYKEYFRILNLTGHGEEERPELYTKSHKPLTTAHNAALQIAFESGWPAGLIYLIFNLVSLLLGLIYAFRNKKTKDYYYLPFLVSFGYFATSLLASMYLPFSNLLMLTYLLVQAPLFTKSGESL